MTKATQKKLLQAIETCKGMLASTGWSAASWLPVRQQMDQFQKMLPEDAGSVTEIITSLQQALQALSEKMDTDTAQETRELVSDLLTAAADRVASLPVKKLFVFLPYKASMWDSLESIWRAAYADKEHCETLVIPIPYCDLSADHKPLQWHVETNLFPKDVPVTSYDAVNLEELHPDAIFVHNPYDQYNRVTSVDSRYYTSHLKNLTDCLVYVPYYVSETVTGQSFCQVPGVVHADLVITQDEANKKQFERYYPIGTPPPGKFLPLGSPKFDKARQARKEDFELPTEWKRIIHGRKILFYCTTISDVLQHTDKVCAKMRSVFDKFRNNSEWAFWWRPHPLMKATFQSMRTGLYEEYCRLEAEYRAEGWGIYDDTAELDRAIAYGDVYYGDHSSVMPLFEVTGKPVVFQDYDYIEEMEPFDIPVWTNDFASDGESLWFVEGSVNMLMRYTPATGRLVCIAKLPVEYFLQEDAYLSVVYTKGKVFLIPQLAERILVYHVEERIFSTILIPFDRNVTAYYYRSFLYENQIYCMPTGDNPYIMRIDSDRERAEIVMDLYRAFRENGLQGHHVLGWVGRFDQENLFLPIYDASCAFLFCMKDASYQRVDFGGFKPYGAAVNDRMLFLSSWKAEQGVVVVEKDTWTVRKQIPTDCWFLRTLANQNVICYTETGSWILLNPKGELLRQERKQSRPNGSLQNPLRYLIGSVSEKTNYVFDTHVSALYTFDETGAGFSQKRISLLHAENLPPVEVWHRDQEILEFAGLDFHLLAQLHPSQESTDSDGGSLAGDKIYKAVFRYLKSWDREAKKA